MKILSLSEFRDFCNGRSLVNATFHYDYQDEEINETCNRKLIMIYKNVFVSPTMQKICLSNDFGTVEYDNVTEVRIHKEYDKAFVFTVVCRGDSTDSLNETFVLNCA